MDNIPLFKGEAMLLSWGDTSSRGKTVTFALHEDDCRDGHPFKGLGTGKFGQRFQIAAVPVDDEGLPLSPGAGTPPTASKSNGERPSTAAVNSTPQNTQERAPGEAKERRRFSELPLPQQVALRCADPDFQAWVARKECIDADDVDETVAATFVRLRCDVHSRAEIKPGSLAEIAWKNLELLFLTDTGRVPEVRG